MILSSCNEIDFVPNHIYVTLFLKSGFTMIKVVLRMNDNLKYSLIKKFVNSNSNKKCLLLFSSTVPLAPLIVSLSNINRKNKAGFVYKNRGRKFSSSFFEYTKHLVIDL